MTVRLLGRNEELAGLQRELAGMVDDGAARLVLVRGEPGIGKSALLRAFVDSVPQAAGEQPVLVGYGQTMTNSLGSDAFQAIRECLRSMLSVAERSSSRESLSRVVFRLRRYRPESVEIDLRPLSAPDTASLIRAAHPGRATTDEQVDRLRQRPEDWTVLTYTDEVLSLDRDKAVAAEAIFRFDVPDLDVLRRQVTSR